MSASPVTRFFAPVRAIVGVALLGATAGWAALLVGRLRDGERISVMALLLAGALGLGAIVAFASAFPTGCRACRKRFVETGGVFPSSLYEPMLDALRRRDASGLRSFADAPSGNAEARTLLDVRHCPACRRVGEAVVSEEHWQGQFFESRRHQTLTLDADTLAALLATVEQRAATHAATAA